MYWYYINVVRRDARVISARLPATTQSGHLSRFVSTENIERLCWADIRNKLQHSNSQKPNRSSDSRIRKTKQTGISSDCELPRKFNTFSRTLINIKLGFYFAPVETDFA